MLQRLCPGLCLSLCEPGLSNNGFHLVQVLHKTRDSVICNRGYKHAAYGTDCVGRPLTGVGWITGQSSGCTISQEMSLIVQPEGWPAATILLSGRFTETCGKPVAWRAASGLVLS